MVKPLTFLFLSLFFLSSCATIEKKEVRTVEEETPQISKVLTEEAPKRFLKRKVAIARFSNETKYGRGFFRNDEGDAIGKQAMDILSVRLASTEKFILLERVDLKHVADELLIGNSTMLDVGADYIIVGSISEFGRKTTGDVGIFSRTKKQTAYARVNIRLIDVYTGQVIYSEEGTGEAFSEAGTVMGVGARAGYDSTLNDKVISAAISKLVSDIIENLLDKPWRSYILAFEGDQYIIGGGKSQGIRVNDVFGVYTRGKRIKNPQTGMFVELPGKLIGKIGVESLIGDNVINEVAFCSVIEGHVPRDGFNDLYIQEIE